MPLNLQQGRKPGTRSATSLGRLIALLSAHISEPRDPADHRHRLWSNRPGQDRGETFALAGMVTLILAGLSVGWLKAWLSPSSSLGWIAVAILTVPAFFALAHALIFAASALDAILRWAGIQVDLPPGHFCGRLYLGWLTGICLIVWFQSDSSVWLKGVAMAWLMVAAMNAAAWFGLSLRDFLRQLSASSRD